MRCTRRRSCAGRSGLGRESITESVASDTVAIAGKRTASAPLCLHIRNAPPGRSTCCIVLLSSCCTRSGDSRLRCGALRRIASHVMPSISKPKRAAKRIARNARRRSSRIRASASPTARITRCSRSFRPSKGSRSSAVVGENAIALRVKSRRARSSSREAPNSTIACLPSVLTSRRNVVTSCMRPVSSNTPTVPKSTPTGTVRRKIFCTCWGVAAVARSQSRWGCPNKASRTAPPTHQVSKPAPSSRRTSATTGWGGVRAWKILVKCLIRLILGAQWSVPQTR